MTRSRVVVSMIAVLMICFSSFSSVMADSGIQQSGIVEPNPAATDPNPISPKSYTYTKYPTFLFTQYEDNIKYRIKVYLADQATLLYKYKGNADCYLSECTLTPDIPIKGWYGLVLGKLRYWEVEVKLDDGSWFGSGVKAQIVPMKASLYSDFNLNRNKWQDIIGTWELASGAYLKNTGVAGQNTSVAMQGYTNGDYVFETKIKLKSKHTYTGTEPDRQSGGLIINGHPYAFIGEKQLWHEGLYILIRNDQKARIFEYWSDDYVESLDTGWVTVTAINPNDWNTIKVVKVGGNLLVKINDEDWMTYIDTVHNLVSYGGFIGLTHYRYADETEKMLVDWANFEKP